MLGSYGDNGKTNTSQSKSKDNLLLVSNLGQAKTSNESTECVSENKKKKFLAWIDSNPENNMAIVLNLDDSIQYKFFTSTLDTAVYFQINDSLLKEGLDRLRIITNMVRVENGQHNYDAGLDLIDEMRLLNYKEPVFIYCGEVSKHKLMQKENFKEKYGDIIVETSAVKCRDFASFKNI